MSLRTFKYLQYYFSCLCVFSFHRYCKLIVTACSLCNPLTHTYTTHPHPRPHTHATHISPTTPHTYTTHTHTHTPHPDSGDSSWYPKEKIRQARKKLQGYNPAHVMLFDLTKGHERSPEFIALKTMLMGEKKYNERAKVSWL